MNETALSHDKIEGSAHACGMACHIANQAMFFERDYIPYAAKYLYRLEEARDTLNRIIAQVPK